MRRDNPSPIWFTNAAGYLTTVSGLGLAAAGLRTTAGLRVDAGAITTPASGVLQLLPGSGGYVKVGSGTPGMGSLTAEDAVVSGRLEIIGGHIQSKAGKLTLLPDTSYVRVGTGDDSYPAGLGTNGLSVQGGIHVSGTSSLDSYVVAPYLSLNASSTKFVNAAYSPWVLGGFYGTYNVFNMHLGAAGHGNNALAIVSHANLSGNYGHSAMLDDPAVFIHSRSAPATSLVQYICAYHNTTEGVIASGAGGLRLIPASGTANVTGALWASGGCGQSSIYGFNASGDLGCGHLTINNGGGGVARLWFSSFGHGGGVVYSGANGTNFFVPRKTSEGGVGHGSFALVSYTYRENAYVTTDSDDPTWYVFSRTAAATTKTQWISRYHNRYHGVDKTGVGGHVLAPYSGCLYPSTTANETDESYCIHTYAAEITLATDADHTHTGFTPNGVVLGSSAIVSVMIDGLSAAEEHFVAVGTVADPDKYGIVGNGAAAATIAKNRKFHQPQLGTAEETDEIIITISGGSDNIPSAGKVRLRFRVQRQGDPADE